MRVFSDRLIDGDDRSWFFGYVQKMVKEVLKEDWNQLFHRFCTNKDSGTVTEDDLRFVILIIAD